MAATTYWVKTVGGNDGAAGTSFAAAYATIEQGLTSMNTAGVGSILNIVNDGDHVWTINGVGSEITLNNGAGSDFDANFGFKIQGVDSAGDPAMATIKASSGEGDAVRFLMYVRNGAGFIIVQNLIMDATEKPTDANGYRTVRYRDNAAGPVLIRYCAILGGLTGVVSSANRSLFEIQTAGSSTETFRMEYCYWQNCKAPMGAVGFGGAVLKCKFDRCVGIWDATGRTNAWFPQSTYTQDTASSDFQFTNCTFYESVGDNVTADVLDYAPSDSIDVGTVDVYSNLIWVDTAKAANGLLPFMGGRAGTVSVDHAGTLDYNVLVGGPNTTAADLLSAGWYEVPWDANDNDATGDDTQANDTVVYEVADTTEFLTPGSSYNWEVEATNSLVIPILKDLRPKTHLTAGLGGSVPGALPAGETDYTVTIASTYESPEPDEALTITVTVSNSGTSATNVVATSLVPAGLTYVSHSADTGSYAQGTGVWTIGGLADAVTATVTIEVTVDSDQSGETITMDADFTSGDPPAGGDTSDDSVTLTLNVQDTSDVDDPENELGQFLNVRPIYTDTYELDFNIRTRTIKNRVTNANVRKDFEKRTYREYSVRRLELDGSSTTTLNIGGIERADFLFMESTTGVKVTLGADQFPSMKMLALGDGDFETVAFENTNSTTATILIVAVD